MNASSPVVRARGRAPARPRRTKSSTFASAARRPRGRDVAIQRARAPHRCLSIFARGRARRRVEFAVARAFVRARAFIHARVRGVCSSRDDGRATGLWSSGGLYVRSSPVRFESYIAQLEVLYVLRVHIKTGTSTHVPYSMERRATRARTRATTSSLARARDARGARGTRERATRWCVRRRAASTAASSANGDVSHVTRGTAVTRDATAPRLETATDASDTTTVPRRASPVGSSRGASTRSAPRRGSSRGGFGRRATRARRRREATGRRRITWTRTSAKNTRA